MSKIKSVCVYCGSNDGGSPIYRAGAEALGKELAEAGIRLVYGGGSVGLMGAIADAVLQHGGEVTGIIPKFLADREVMHKGIEGLIVTADMHERKRLMFEHAESFVALPGGIGTLEELIEMLTWAQLGQHKKPVLVANLDGFWDHLVSLMGHMRDQGFLPGNNGVDFLEARSVEQIIPALNAAAEKIARAELERTGQTGIIAKM